MMTVLLLTLIVFGAAMVAMAVGLFFRRPCLRGSCGGPDVLTAEGESLRCIACPNRRRRAQAVVGGSSSARQA